MTVRRAFFFTYFIVIACRSDLDLETTEYKISAGGIALAEILSVVVRSGLGPKVCFSTLYRVDTLKDENLAEIDRHLKSIAKLSLFIDMFSWPGGSQS